MGAGMVIAPKMGTYAQHTCETYRAVICPIFWYAKGDEVPLRAYPPSGGRFLGWTGPCGGTGETCKYRNRQYREGTITLVAKFG
jgi:hypothetical protein